MSANSSTFGTIFRAGALAALLTLGACADNDGTPVVPDTSGQALSLAPGKIPGSADYRLGPNDRTRIIVFGQPTLTGEFVLDGNGVLSYPLVGNINASGMTPAELQTAIARKLDKDWVNNPSVSVEVSSRRPFYVVGEVQKPGSYPYVTDMSLLNAVATAGGQTYRANMHDFWIKRKVNGRVVRVQATQESMLQPGDVVVVRERYF
jgi:polysaccharide export outer membrane protein